MKLMSSPRRWGVVMQVLHWTTALLVFGLLAVGLVMDEMATSPTKIKVFAMHKSFGITLLALVLLRLLWRVIDRRPKPAPMPAWQRWAARLTHVGLYASVLVMAISGWLYNSASNFALKWFGLFSVPSISAPDKALKHFAHEVHETTWIVILVLIALHVGAALKHHLIDKDDTLTAMLPGKPETGDAP
ncbi:MAG: cytochrome b [Xanthomonadales bacterium]|nr:cytochrome b [Xanthomonadales bacterium]